MAFISFGDDPSGDCPDTFIRGFGGIPVKRPLKEGLVTALIKVEDSKDLMQQDDEGYKDTPKKNTD